ncbi:cytochrome P450 78A5-like [Neltuma alba]|uniref:cytochrome P450 78A5-like n=1 Tax=Neltuma alba TaxID=207710 RepID=UPI0010A45BA0|nr:cytochrome P450 78A5-like [Prosopis alba]
MKLIPVLFLFLVLGLEITSQIILSSSSWPLSLFLSIFAISLNYWFVPGGFAWRNYGYGNNINVSGPMGWPILGSLPQMGSLAHRKLATMAASLNAKRLMVISLGANPVIIASHPETAQEILCSLAFSDRPIKESARLLMFERAIGFAPNGEYWRQLRKITAVHLFCPKRISGQEGIRRQVVEEMMKKVWKEMEEKGVVQVREIFQEGSLGNILEGVFGNCTSSKREELGHMVKEGYELIVQFNWEDYFPFKFMDFGRVKRKCQKLAGKVTRVVGQMVEERKTSAKLNGEEDNDFLGALLSLPKEERLSDSDIVAILWEMMFRGTDTIAILLEWIMTRMVLHQDIQTKARQEIDERVGQRNRVRDIDISNLPYLQSIVKEVLRLHPPGPLLSWARLAVHDVHIGKFHVPAGTTAMVNMWAITHDPCVWEDPWVFKPERFTKDDVSIMGSNLRLAPFGAGRRVCPGRALGLATVHLWLAQLLHQFVWLSIEPVDLSECLKLSLELKKPLKCKLVPRFNATS